MNIKNWEEEFEGKMWEDNDANDYFYEWIAGTFDSGKDKNGENLTDLLIRSLDLCLYETKVRVKVGKGIIFIQNIEDEHNKRNTSRTT